MLSHSCLIQDFNWWKVWTAGKPIQHPNSSPMKSCFCKYARPSLKIVIWIGAHVALIPVYKPVFTFLQRWCLSTCSSCQFQNFNLYLWISFWTVFRQRILEVFLKPCNDFHHIIISIRYWFSALSFAHRDFSRLSESFDDMMHCSWWDI